MRLTQVNPNTRPDLFTAYGRDANAMEYEVRDCSFKTYLIDATYETFAAQGQYKLLALDTSLRISDS